MYVLDTENNYGYQKGRAVGENVKWVKGIYLCGDRWKLNSWC